MKTHSLRLRLQVIQVITIAMALIITGYGLIYLFERHVERRIGSELDTYIAQIAARLSFEPSGMPHLAGKLADPRFENIFSGLYWQINNETAGVSARSRSLWDTRMTLPNDTPGFGKVHIHYLAGPQSSSVLVHERRLLFKSPAGEQTVRVIVAIDTAELSSLSSKFSFEVAIALAILGLFLLLAGWFQVTIGLSPLALVQKSLSAVRSGTVSRIKMPMPPEVSPLVDEVNNLLSAQEKTIQKAKNRAGDLAHGFKTPLTALTTDVKRLRGKGEIEIANDIETTALAMRRQIERELNKARIRDVRTMPIIEVLPVIDRIVTTLQRTPDSESKDFQIECNQNLGVQIDKDDLTEIFGNLLENAVKHATSRIIVKGHVKNTQAIFEIEDDGEGISSSLREIAQKRGVRLDETISGSGLGLAIVGDVLEAYDKRLTLETSSLGGLKASFQLPLSTPIGP